MKVWAIGRCIAAVLFACLISACAPHEKPGVVTERAYSMGSESVFSPSDPWGVVVIGHAAAEDDHQYVSIWGRIDPTDGRFINFAEVRAPVEFLFTRTARFVQKPPYTLPLYEAYRLPPGTYRLLRGYSQEDTFWSGTQHIGNASLGGKAENGTPLQFEVRAGQVTFFGHFVTRRDGKILRVDTDEKIARADLKNVPAAVLTAPWIHVR